MSFGTLKTLINIGKNTSNDYTVPVSKTLEKNNEYETRLYEKTRFIAFKYRSIDTQVTNNKPSGKKDSDEDPVMKNVWRIMKYTQGENEKKLNMKLYMPVFVFVENLGNINNNVNGEIEVEVRIMVALPPEFQADKDEPPKPDDPDLYFEIEPEFKCYVRKFSGFADENAFKVETEKLRKSVKEANLKANDSRCICISYDPPYKLINRKNEVIIISL